MQLKIDFSSYIGWKSFDDGVPEFHTFGWFGKLLLRHKSGEEKVISASGTLCRYKGETDIKLRIDLVDKEFFDESDILGYKTNERCLNKNTIKIF
jgi:hypothetical protein